MNSTAAKYVFAMLLMVNPHTTARAALLPASQVDSGVPASLAWSLGDINGDGFGDIGVLTVAAGSSGPLVGMIALAGPNYSKLWEFFLPSLGKRSPLSGVVGRLNWHEVSENQTVLLSLPSSLIKDGAVVALSGKDGKQQWIKRGTDLDSRFGSTMCSVVDTNQDKVRDVLVGGAQGARLGHDLWLLSGKDGDLIWRSSRTVSNLDAPIVFPQLRQGMNDYPTVLAISPASVLYGTPENVMISRISVPGRQLLHSEVLPSQLARSRHYYGQEAIILRNTVEYTDSRLVLVSTNQTGFYSRPSLLAGAMKPPFDWVEASSELWDGSSTLVAVACDDRDADNIEDIAVIVAAHTAEAGNAQLVVLSSRSLAPIQRVDAVDDLAWCLHASCMMLGERDSARLSNVILASCGDRVSSFQLIIEMSTGKTMRRLEF